MTGLVNAEMKKVEEEHEVLEPLNRIVEEEQVEGLIALPKYLSDDVGTAASHLISSNHDNSIDRNQRRAPLS